jgi:hypothetical protein
MTRGGDEDGEREKADAETNRRDGDSSVVPNLYRREELLPLAGVAPRPYARTRGERDSRFGTVTGTRAWFHALFSGTHSSLRPLAAPPPPGSALAFSFCLLLLRPRPHFFFVVAPSVLLSSLLLV